MELLHERRRRLYGPERFLQTQKICKTLTKSNVLQDGEYNYTTNKLKEGVWQTSSKRDFQGTEVNQDNTPPGVSQLDHHFRFGNDTGTQLPSETYQGSTTKDDYETKNMYKPPVFGIDRTVNWPDMAPRYATDRNVGQSEYKNTFMMAGRAMTAPAFPRVDTSKMKLPLDPQQFYLQRNSHFDFGHDEPSGVSENMRTFGRAEKDNLSDKLARSDHVQKIKQKMKSNELASNVFRDGDYNGHTLNYESTNVGDYGPRTKPPAEILASEIYQEQLRKENKTDTKSKLLKNIPNELASYARSNTVPGVFRDATAGRRYQTAAHFEFGSDTNGPSSIYAKDFAPEVTGKPSKPAFYEPPSAGKLFQNDPDYSKFGTPSSKTDFMFHAVPETVGSDGKTTMERNMDGRHGDNVILSHDPSRHADDRKISLSHGDYKGPPRAFKALKPLKAPRVEFDYLQTNDAMPYEGLPRISEAKNTFAGAFMSGIHAMERRRQKDEQCRDRKEMGKSTHFTLGYSGPDFVSETANQFDGRVNHDKDIPAAGKKETPPDSKFDYLNVSENTMDLKANDPYQCSSKESVTIQGLFEPARAEHAFTTSVMKSDFRPVAERRMNEHQQRMLEKYDKLVQKTIKPSHFFHTDNTGCDNYQSTTMNDFIKPEVMTGQKLLAAR